LVVGEVPRFYLTQPLLELIQVEQAVLGISLLVVQVHLVLEITLVEAVGVAVTSLLVLMLQLTMVEMAETAGAEAGVLPTLEHLVLVVTA
jgi:hypothetical protein